MDKLFHQEIKDNQEKNILMILIIEKQKDLKNLMIMKGLLNKEITIQIIR
jgi:hypothetical protein